MSTVKRMVIANQNNQVLNMKSVGVSDPGDPQPNRLVNFVSRVPAQMG
jgi:hypothetical protein